ncbi:SigE family RNA polymerase sigma factor [Nocardioidaceae bacterium SCSIO 66511]|nr:SigE family RNA polymerase sigma factor [Nocardioidaceae bacterium SCSIO 66511]
MKADDREAFVEFASARSAALLRYAYLLLGDRQLAEDLLQESLTKTYVAMPRLRDRHRLEAYARKTLTRTAISWWRRKGWSAEKPRDDVPESGGSTHGDDVVDRAWMWGELQILPSKQRAAIVLRFYEDCTYSEIAEAMNCAEGTAKSQVSRGLDRLRMRIGRDAVPAKPEVKTT